MSDWEFDKIIKSKLESVQLTFDENDWLRISKRLERHERNCKPPLVDLIKRASEIIRKDF